MTSEQRADSDPTGTLASRADAAVLEVWDGERLKATVIASPAGPYTVTNAALVATLGAETDLTLLAEETAKRVATYQDGSPTTNIGPPTSGTRVLTEFWRDALGGEWRCTGAGTPGTWLQIRPAAVAADPASGNIPAGYPILNVMTGHIKRHAGRYVWEVPVV